MFLSHSVLFPMLLAAASSKLLYHSPDKSNIYSNSIVGIYQLLQTEKKLVSNLKDYNDLMQQKINIFRLALHKLSIEHSKFDNNAEGYISNPLNCFALIRRLHESMPLWQAIMHETVGLTQIRFINDQHHLLPTDEDLNEVTGALLNLQSTYELKPEDLANGFIYDEQFDAKLSSLECLHIGENLFANGKYARAIDWLQLATRDQPRWKQQVSEILGLNRSQIWHKIKLSYFRLFNLVEALKTLQTAFEYDEDIETIKLNFKHNEGCRGEFELTTGNLKCYYKTSKNQFLKLAPIKVEQVHSDPRVLMFHDVIYDSEIKLLTEYTSTRLKRVLLGKGISPEYRSSQSVLLTPNSTAQMQTVQKRLIDMTDYNEKLNSRGLYFINYGMGGYYYVHPDGINASDIVPPGEKAKLLASTILFYLNDVESGGLTTFPNLKMSFHPKKGTAILWDHQDSNGYIDQRMEHAACPVIFGSKWSEFNSKTLQKIFL